jgi:hypothetical protein
MVKVFLRILLSISCCLHDARTNNVRQIESCVGAKSTYRGLTQKNKYAVLIHQKYRVRHNLILYTINKNNK